MISIILRVLGGGLALILIAYIANASFWSRFRAEPVLLAHRGMALIDRGRDPRAVAVLGLDRLGEPGIGRAQLQLESAPLSTGSTQNCKS